MRKKIKQPIIWVSIILTILVVVTFIIFLYGVFTPDCDLIESIFGVTCGILSNLAFGFWVAYVFKKIEEKKIKEQNNDIIQKIRKREFSKINSTFNQLVLAFYLVENRLIQYFEGLKGSFKDNKIDVENITDNLFVFNEAYNSIDDYNFTEKEKKQIKYYIDNMMFKETDNFKDVSFSMFDTLDIYQECFVDFNLACKDLFSNMESINIQYKLTVFADDEIDAVRFFARKCQRFMFWLDPPSQVVALFTHLAQFVKFLDTDFIPSFLKETFLKDVDEQEKIAKEKEIEYKEWENKYITKAKAFLADFKKRKQ